MHRTLARSNNSDFNFTLSKVENVDVRKTATIKYIHVFLLECLYQGFSAKNLQCVFFFLKINPQTHKPTCQTAI